MAKVRVYELAKELGVDSKTIMTKLNAVSYTHLTLPTILLV